MFPLMIGTTEIVLLAGVALLLFGGKKLPGMMRSLGKGVKEFKEGVQGAPEDFKAGMEDKDKAPDSNESTAQLTHEETEVEGKQNEQ